MSNVLKYYDYLHTIPEPAFEEVKTSKFLGDKLEEFGYEVHRNIDGQTGVVGIYDSGVPGPVVAIRADMDSLVHIIDGKTCARHTCGHDGHSSVVLSVAEILKETKAVKKGKVKIIFQPAEETCGGAESIIAGGFIDDVDYIFGSHVRPEEELKDGQATAAVYYSASNHALATIHGKPAHGARPHLGINAVDAGTAAVVAVNTIHLSPNAVYSVKPTRFVCDSGVRNAIPDKAELVWDLRSQENATMDQLKEKVTTAVLNAGAAVGATVDFEITKGVPAAEYSEECKEILAKSIVEVLGEDGLVPKITTPGGEDFFYYVKYKPSIKAGFFGLGCGLTPGLHHPDMHFNKASLENGVKIFLATLRQLVG